MGEFQRWNTHHSHVVPIEVCGHHLNIAQDPTSDNLGTTIWDASVILVRYMERNPQLYSRRKLEGKRVLELGAGCGLAGMYFALQGAHVTFTDLIEVVPLLQRNVTMNLGGQATADSTNGNHGKGSNGEVRPKAEVLEYCWGMPIDGLKPPYDYVVACDCVYVERLVEALVWSMTQVSGRGTTVLVASEKREEVTYAKFRARLSEEFTVRQAPRRHMDKSYDHENSEVLVCKMRRPAKGGGADAGLLGGGGTVAGDKCATVEGLVEMAVLEGKTGEKLAEDTAGGKHEADETASADTTAVSPDDASLPLSFVSDHALEGGARELSGGQDARHGTQLEVPVPGDEVDAGVGGLSLAEVSLVTSPKGAAGCKSRSKVDIDRATGGAARR